MNFNPDYEYVLVYLNQNIFYTLIILILNLFIIVHDKIIV